MICSNEKSYIGIDVSKLVLDLYVLPCNKHMQFKNDVKGIHKLRDKLKSFLPALIVMEATGGYEKRLAQSLKQAEFEVSIVNPRPIRDFARALGKLAKTDKIDAQTIALFAERMRPEGNVVLNENQERLAENNARRHQLIKMITMEKNRLDKVSKEMKKSIGRIIAALEKELKAILANQEEVIKGDESYAQRNELLQSIKGVGTVVAASLISDLPELGSMKAKQISALVGLAPYNRDSGTLRGKRTLWGGRASVRCTLYMATLVATRYNPQIKAFYERLCGVGKLKKVALTACMHKLLIVMNAMIKNNQLWQPCMN